MDINLFINKRKLLKELKKFHLENIKFLLQIPQKQSSIGIQVSNSRRKYYLWRSSWFSKVSIRKIYRIETSSWCPSRFFLSGGVDSNSLISIALKKFGYNVHGFTIMNTDKRYEEKILLITQLIHLELNIQL